MSRHEISARNPAHKVIVGWHQPLRTYFVQVIDRRETVGDDDRRMILWAGKRPNELHEIDKLAQKLAKFADLAPEMRARLCGDKHAGR